MYLRVTRVAHRATVMAMRHYRYNARHIQRLLKVTVK